MSDETKCDGDRPLPWGMARNPLLDRITQLEQQLAVAVAALVKIWKIVDDDGSCADIAAEALTQIGATDDR